MKWLDRYLGVTLAETIFLVVLVLLGVEAFLELLNELQDIGRGNYGVLQALCYVPLQLPRDLYQLFPVAALIGCLAGLGRLASSSELIVMRASGVSKWGIAQSVMKMALVLLICVTLIGEFLSPRTQVMAENYKSLKQTGVPATTARQGIWVHDGNNFIHIGIILPGTELLNVVRYQFDEKKLRLASFAERAHLIKGDWIFENVHESIFLPAKVVQAYYPQQSWAVSFDPNLLGMSALKSDQASLWQIHQYINYLHNNGLLATRYEFLFWQRIFQPLATLVMIALAVPFVFGPLRSASMGLRILLGIVVGFGFYTLNQLLGPFSLVYAIPPIVAAGFPTFLFGGIAALLFSRNQ